MRSRSIPLALIFLGLPVIALGKTPVHEIPLEALVAKENGPPKTPFAALGCAGTCCSPFHRWNDRELLDVYLEPQKTKGSKRILAAKIDQQATKAFIRVDAFGKAQAFKTSWDLLFLIPPQHYLTWDGHRISPLEVPHGIENHPVKLQKKPKTENWLRLVSFAKETYWMPGSPIEGPCPQRPR